MIKSIAAITMARNDAIFMRRWIDYYGAQFGEKNLFIILDGHDQKPTENIGDANLITLPHVEESEVYAMKRRMRIISNLAKSLFEVHDIVLATDIDEFLICDPKTEMSLSEYLSNIKNRSSISGLGIDVGQHIDLEPAIDLNRPFLDQRKYAHVSARYTKPATTFRPVRWGSGLHRIKGRNFHIDPNLYHFHFGMVCTSIIHEKKTATGSAGEYSRAHLQRRHKMFDLIRLSTPIPGDDYFQKARRYQSLFRPLYALNKPGMIPSKPIIEIPERFRGLV